jgi:hypothetical protein
MLYLQGVCLRLRVGEPAKSCELGRVSGEVLLLEGPLLGACVVRTAQSREVWRIEGSSSADLQRACLASRNRPRNSDLFSCARTRDVGGLFRFLSLPRWRSSPVWNGIGNDPQGVERKGGSPVNIDKRSRTSPSAQDLSVARIPN